MAREDQTDLEETNRKSAMSHATTSHATSSAAQAANSLARLAIHEDNSGAQASIRGRTNIEARVDARVPVIAAGMDERAEEVEWDCAEEGREAGKVGVGAGGEGEEGDDWEVHDASGYTTGNSENGEHLVQSEECTPRGSGVDVVAWEVSDDSGADTAGEANKGSKEWEVKDVKGTHGAVRESGEEWEVVGEDSAAGRVGECEKMRGGTVVGRKSLSRFDIQCPPGGEEKIVLYATSLQGIRKTYSDCAIIRGVLQRMSLPFDERDVAIHLDFRSELKSVLDMPSVSVPQLFIRGHHIGGADVVTQLVDEDAFVELVEEIKPIKGPPQVCKGCGNMKFVPCLQCSGSHKIQDEYGEREDCPTCNENGLIRCPWCAA